MEINLQNIAFNCLFIVLFSSFVCAQENPNYPTTEDTLGSTYENNLKLWQSLSEKERTMIRELAQTLQPDQLEELRKKFEKFRNLPPEKQEEILANYQKFMELPPEKKKELSEKAARFLELEIEKREELRRTVNERNRQEDAPRRGGNFRNNQGQRRDRRPLPDHRGGKNLKR